MCINLSEVVRLDCEPPIGQLETKRLTKDLLISGGGSAIVTSRGDTRHCSSSQEMEISDNSRLLYNQSLRRDFLVPIFFP